MPSALFGGLLQPDASQTGLEWSCPATSSGEFTPLFTSCSEQWFTVHVEQLACQKECSHSIKTSTFSSQIKRRELSRVQAECLSLDQANHLEVWREQIMLSREHGVGMQGANPLTQAIMEQRAACQQQRASCESVYTSTAPDDPNGRQNCIDACSDAVAACSAYTSRKDVGGGSSLYRGYLEDSRSFTDLCACDFMDFRNEYMHPPAPILVPN